MASTVDSTPLQNDEERKSNTDRSTDNTPRGNIIIWLIETYDTKINLNHFWYIYNKFIYNF